MGRCGGESTSMSNDPAAMDATASLSSHVASAASAASTSRPRARQSRGIFVLAAGRRCWPPTVAAGRRHRPSVSAAAATLCCCFDIYWSPWVSRPGPVNRQTGLPSHGSTVVRAPTRAGDRNIGSVWVRCGLVPDFAAPTNRAS
jgi:hypothetical protein